MRRLVPALLLMLAGCAPPAPADARMEADAAQGELAARPGIPASPSTDAGLRRIGTGARAAYLYVPKSYRANRPAPFILMLHGAGGSGQHGIDLVTGHADRLGLIVLAPSSRAQSWDMISNRSYGADIGPLDAALAEVFAQYSVDPERVAVGGFSDGASYALSLGLINGSLFRRIIAFSPGFMRPTRAEGRPAIFISHGVRDQVLPIDNCSRRIVPALRKGGYEVEYEEFQGDHTVPEDLAGRAYEALSGP